MAASIFDHPVILIVVVLASILRWLWQKSQQEKQDTEAPPASDQPITRGGDTQTEEERIRRFLEALGQPAGSAPPPKVAPKRQIGPLLNPTLPRLTTAPPPLPPPLPAATARPSPAPARPRRIFTPAVVQELGFEVHDIALQTTGELPVASHRAEGEQSNLKSKLASKEGLRTAIILREIFGPPRSLQPFDPINSF